MTESLPARLRFHAEHVGGVASYTMREAADEIERLRAEVMRKDDAMRFALERALSAEAALKPFAAHNDAATARGSTWAKSPDTVGLLGDISIGDFRRASAALRPTN